MTNARASLQKGQIKCSQCRAVVRSRDGEWHNAFNQQVFRCRTCENAKAPKTYSGALVVAKLPV